MDNTQDPFENLIRDSAPQEETPNVETTPEEQEMYFMQIVKELRKTKHFYVISLHDNYIQAQGTATKASLKYWKKDAQSFVFDNDHQWFDISVYILGIHIKITLCIN